MKAKKIWLLDFPVKLYNENVKKLALDNNLHIIDAKFSNSFNESEVEAKPPKVTLVSDNNKPKRAKRKSSSNEDAAL